MEALLQNIEWTPTLVSFVAAFALGWLWYSPTLFVERWARESGLNLADKSGSMMMAMIAQAVSTFLFAIVVNVAMMTEGVAYAVLIALVLAGFVKANGLFKKATMYVIRVESGYILAMAALMILVNYWL